MKKILATVLVVLLVIVVLLGVGLQMFLTKGLTSALNNNVFPAVKSMYGLDMSIENASVNILKGTADLKGFTTRNLKGYEEPYLLRFDECRMEIDMMSLLKRNPIVIKEAKAIGALLVIERNSEKQINVQELFDALKPVKSAEEASPTEPKDKPAKAAKPVPVHIQKIIANVKVVYADSGKDRTYPLELNLTANDLFTVAADGQPTSRIALSGSLADDENSFATDLTASIEPLTHPKKPTFTISGSILNIDAALFDEALAKNNIKGDSFSIRPSIRCQKGQLKDSFIKLSAQNLQIKNTHVGGLDNVKLPILSEPPWIDFTGILTSLPLDLALNFGLSKLQEELGGEIGIGSTGSPQEALIGALTNNVKELQDAAPALQAIIEQMIPSTQSTNSAITNGIPKTVGDVMNALEKELQKPEMQELTEQIIPSGKTNKPSKKATGDALINVLEDNINELEDNEAVKDVLRGFFN
jgi:hypothetical protein